jgi:Uma2 family endonuclease
MNKPSALAASGESPALFTADEFMQIATRSPIADWVGKVELVEGVIVRMSPAKNLHFHYQRQLFRKLDALFGEGRDGYIAGQEPTVRLGPRTVRDPDVAILRDMGPSPDINRADDVLLVAEVSDTSLRQDRGSKLRTYAKAGIPHYWIVDIKGRAVEVMSNPEEDSYLKKEQVPFGEPLPVPGTSSTITIE